MATSPDETLTKKLKLPKFFIDASESDKLESMMDFFIAWTIRCAPDEYIEVNRSLQENSKKILSKILFDDELYLEDKKVINVKTIKQFKSIDILAEITIQNKNKEVAEYALIIENKVYSSIRNGQLAKYKEIAQEEYNESFKIKCVLIQLDYHNIDINKEICLKDDYTVHVVDDFTEMLAGRITGNDLFDEFWFNFNYNDIN